MKIKCSYCGNMFDDTNPKCPDCGAANEGVVRTADDQPITIDGLKKWYSDRGLPPYEVTRFFIGEDCRQPRAFGIYKDGSTGNFVVYKNKTSGERAVRYEGTDEAYAVNELYMRLKQEILNQKANNISKSSGGSGRGSRRRNRGPMGVKEIFKKIGILMLMLYAMVGISLLSDKISESNLPKSGYYDYGGSAYYHSSPDKWFRYDSSGEWEYISSGSLGADELKKRKTAKKYFLGADFSSGYPCGDFSDTVWAKDIECGFSSSQGYYSVDSDVYYYLGNNWYYYDYDDSDKWIIYDNGKLPYELQHPSVASDFYFTPTWDSSIQFSSFEDTSFYSDYQASRSSSRDNRSDSDSSYDWDSNDSWDAGGMDWDSDW